MMMMFMMTMIHDSVQDMEESVHPAARREMMRITTGAKLPGILLRSSFLIMIIDDCDDYDEIDDDDDEVDD